MGIDVEEYMSLSGRSRENTPNLRINRDKNDDGTQPPGNDDGGIGDAASPTTEEPQGLRETQKSFNPFIGEYAFTHATKDKDHGAQVEIQC